MTVKITDKFALLDEDLLYMPVYKEYVTFFRAIKFMAVEKLGDKLSVYDFSDIISLTVFKEDIKVDDGRLEIIGYSSPFFPTIRAGIIDDLDDEDDDYDFPVEIIKNRNDHQFDPSVEPALLNSILYYPKFNIVLAYFPLMDTPGSVSERTVVFGVNNDDVEKFADYMYKREREINQTGIMVITDGPRGFVKKRTKINDKVKRESVFMEEHVKTEIFRSIDEFFNGSREFYIKYEIPYRRGILLYGKPGNGKTTLVKSIANSANAPVIYWQITEFTSSESITGVFNYAAIRSPTILVIEDIDSMPVNARSIFLNILDGATSKDGIFLIGTTNFPDKVDIALMNRAGRFDRAYEIKQPTEQTRYEYLKFRKLDQLISDEEVRNAAKLMKDFSISSLNELYTSAALQQYYDGKIDIEGIIKDLRDVSKKQQYDAWNDDEKHSLGFMR